MKTRLTYLCTLDGGYRYSTNALYLISQCSNWWCWWWSTNFSTFFITAASPRDGLWKGEDVEERTTRQTRFYRTEAHSIFINIIVIIILQFCAFDVPSKILAIKYSTTAFQINCWQCGSFAIKTICVTFIYLFHYSSHFIHTFTLYYPLLKSSMIMVIRNCVKYEPAKRNALTSKLQDVSVLLFAFTIIPKE